MGWRVNLCPKEEEIEEVIEEERKEVVEEEREEVVEEEEAAVQVQVVAVVVPTAMIIVVVRVGDEKVGGGGGGGELLVMINGVMEGGENLIKKGDIRRKGLDMGIIVLDLKRGVVEKIDMVNMGLFVKLMYT